jgi:arylsulfatase A-like enzyme
MDGVSLLPLLNDPASDIHEQLAFINTWGTLATQSLTVLTKDMKYTYWWYGDKTMTPTEDLFNLEKDPMEMTNLAANPEAAPLMEKMRKKYDDELTRWKAEAVSS